jgi:hypothetical protein
LSATLSADGAFPPVIAEFNRYMATEMTVDDLIARVSVAPHDQLSRKSLRCLNAYLAGYDASLGANTGNVLSDPIDRDAWEAWRDQNVKLTVEHADRLNAFSCFSLTAYAELLAADDRDAFDVYVDLRQRIQRSRVAHNEPSKCTISQFSRCIVDNLACVVQRPAMHFGNGCSTHELFAFANGFIACDSDLENGEDNRRILSQFQDWVNVRYPIASTRPWSHTFHFLALSDGPSALKCFEEHFVLFRNAAPPDVQDPMQRRIIENISSRVDRDPL